MNSASQEAYRFLANEWNHLSHKGEVGVKDSPRRGLQADSLALHHCRFNARQLYNM